MKAIGWLIGLRGLPIPNAGRPNDFLFFLFLMMSRTWVIMAGMVRSMMVRSNHRDLFSIVFQIKTNHLIEGGRVLPGHLPEPVRPGRVLYRSFCQSRCRSNSQGRQGRGPTRLMSPRSTLMTCGNSSSPVAAQLTPKRNNPRVPVRIHLDHRKIRIDQPRAMPLVNGGIRVGHHRPELQTREPLAEVAHPLLVKQNGPLGSKLDQYRDHHHDRKQRPATRSRCTQYPVLASSGESAPSHCLVISEPEVVLAGDSCAWIKIPLLRWDGIKLPGPEIQ